MSSKPKNFPKAKDPIAIKWISPEPKRKYKVEPTKKETIRQKSIKTLEAYKSSDPVNNQLMQIIKKQYIDGDIQNIKTATSAMKSLMNENLNEFKKQFAKITTQIPKKMPRQEQTREKARAKLDSKISQVVEVVDRVMKPGITIRSWEAEAPLGCHVQEEHQDLRGGVEGGVQTLNETDREAYDGKAPKPETIHRHRIHSD